MSCLDLSRRPFKATAPRGIVEIEYVSAHAQSSRNPVSQTLLIHPGRRIALYNPTMACSREMNPSLSFFIHVPILPSGFPISICAWTDSSSRTDIVLYNILCFMSISSLPAASGRRNSYQSSGLQDSKRDRVVNPVRTKVRN